MGGARHGKGNVVCKAYFGVVEGRSVSYFEFWLNALRFWRESKGRRFLQTLVFVLLFCFTSVAYADSGYQSGLAGVIQGPSAWYEYGASVDDPYYGYFCYAYDNYDAAVWSLGLNPTSSSFTAEAKTKLSNASTGGRFYTYANKFHTFGANSEPHAWLSRDFYGQWVTLYGRDFLYWGEVTTAEQDGAKADLQTILNGGSLGGTVPSYNYVAGYYYKIDARQSNFAPLPDYWDIDFLYVSKDYIDAALQWLASNYPNSKLYVSAHYNSNRQTWIQVCYASPNMYKYNGSPRYWLGYDSYCVTVGGQNNIRVPNDNNNVNMVQWQNASSITLENIRNGNGNNGNPTTYFTIFDASDYELVYLDPTGNNWPDSGPVDAPQPPELPEPGDPVIDDEPDPTFPVYVDVSTTNYTADLQGVLDAMDDHCIHLQESIWWGFNSFWNKLYQYITWSVGVIQSEFAATRDYLYDLFQWLAEQFDYSVSGGAYNDSTVVSWLKKIYSTLGLGVNTRPTDPVADPDGIGDWLGQLFANFIAWLMGFGAGLVAGLADDFAELTTKFPFSIPWDIGAMLALIVAEPQAPSFDYPLYTMDATGSLVQAGTLEVDLSDFDSYMVGIRFMQKLLFCMYLAWRTPQLKELLRIGRSR